MQLRRGGHDRPPNAPRVNHIHLSAFRPVCAPCPAPISGEAPTPDPHVTPPRREGQLSALSFFGLHPCPGEADTVRRRLGGSVEVSDPTPWRALTMKTKRYLWLAATVLLTGMVLVLSWAPTAPRVHAAPLDPSTPVRAPG